MQTTHLPVFATLQHVPGASVPFILLLSPDPRVGRVVAVEVYSTLAHAVKGLATQNFMNLPATLKQARTRLSQLPDE